MRMSLTYMALVASLALIGPSGDWKISSMKGVKNVSAKSGVVPASLVLERDPASDALDVQFNFVSPQSVTTVFGDKIAAGRPYQFGFKRFEKKLDWKVQFFNYQDTPPDSFEGLTPVTEKKVDELFFAWWGKPDEGVNEDKFATLSTSRFSIAPGEYAIELTSDDGVRLYLDGKLLIDNWDIHEPETDTLRVKLGGEHQVRIEHYEGGGFGTLDFRLNVVD